MERSAAAHSDRVTRRSAFISAGLGAAAAVIGSAIGHPVPAVSAGVGFLLGAVNALMAQKLANSGLPFGATSLLRLLLLTMVAVGVSLGLGFHWVWLIIGGLAVSELVLSANAAAEVVAHR